MAYLEWSVAYETGIPGIDGEHRELVSMLNDIHELVAGGAEAQDIGEALAEFYTLATAHFALEEKIMQDENYAGLGERRITHHRLLDEVCEIIDACETGSCELNDSLPATLKDWLLEAIAGDVGLLADIGETSLRRPGLARR